MKYRGLRLGVLLFALMLTLSVLMTPAHALEFSDVPENFWGGEGYRNIKAMADRGLAKGYADGTFRPDGKMTAVETLLFCARATGVDASMQMASADGIVKEVSEILPTVYGMNHWAAGEIAVAVEAGVLSLAELKGLSQIDPRSVEMDGSGNVIASRTYLEETIPREQVCMYLTRAMGLESQAWSLSDRSMNGRYKDAFAISPSMLPYIYVLTEYGVVRGKETGNFDPQGAVTRAEMTTMLCRALDVMENSTVMAKPENQQIEHPNVISEQPDLTVSNAPLQNESREALWDVSGNAPYAEAVNYVCEAGIMTVKSDGRFDPEDAVTLGEMAAITCRLLGFEADVPAGAETYMEKAMEYGIISGDYGSAEFDDAVTYEQAVTMVVRCAGLNVDAIEAGGYPNGYLKTAHEMGLLNGISSSIGAGVNRSQIAILVYNLIV